MVSFTENIKVGGWGDFGGWPGMCRAFCRVKDAVAGIDGLSAQVAEIRRLGKGGDEKKNGI